VSDSGGSAVTGTIVYDPNTPENWPGPAAWITAYREWLAAHGIDANVTYRVEHHIIDCPLIRVFQWAVDDHGRKFYLDPATGSAARREPFDVLITSAPPRQEDYR
jgi:hypothetical protein